MKEAIALAIGGAILILAMYQFLIGKTAVGSAMVIMSIFVGLAVSNYDSIRMKFGEAEIETAKKEIESFKDETLAELTEDVKKQEESITKLIKNADETADRLEKQIIETAEKAAPPTLKLVGNEVKKLDEKIEASLQFKPNKNVPLGVIVFKVYVEKKSNANILDIWPDIRGGAFNTGDDSKQIEENEKSGSLTYSLIGSGSPTIKVTLSEEAVIQIESNYLEEPVKLEIAIKK